MIHETGYWSKENSLSHHINSENLSNRISDYLSKYKDHQIYDFGCGLGDYLNDLSLKGFKKLKGIEADPMKTNQDFEILQLDLSQPFILDEKGIIICLEVGEHIPEKYQETFLNNIFNNCDKYLIMSWAVRGQGGLVFRINKNNVSEVNSHESEKNLNDYEFDYIINNDSTKEDLYRGVDSFFIRESL
jgi:SAM-dependent methyltransferase